MPSNAEREALARALNDDDVARRFAEPWEHCNAQTIDWYLCQADAALAWFHRRGQITEAMVEAAERRIRPMLLRVTESGDALGIAVAALEAAEEVWRG